MTTARAVETSVTVNKNNPIQDYVYPDDHTQRGGHWDFRFCGFGYFLDRFFGFDGHCGLRIFRFLASGFRFS